MSPIKSPRNPQCDSCIHYTEGPPVDCAAVRADHPYRNIAVVHKLWSADNPICPDHDPGPIMIKSNTPALPNCESCSHFVDCYSAEADGWCSDHKPHPDLDVKIERLRRTLHGSPPEPTEPNTFTLPLPRARWAWDPRGLAVLGVSWESHYMRGIDLTLHIIGFELTLHIGPR